MSGPVVKVEDIRREGLCLAGVRRHCRETGIDFRRLVTTGIPVEEVEDSRDEHVRRIVANAMRRSRNGQETDG